MLQKLALFSTAVVWFSASSYGQIPECLSGSGALGVDNQQVLNWKVTTPNQFLSRAHISGYLIAQYPDKNGHQHFKVQIGSHARDTIEVVYNIEFGRISNLRMNAQVEACGDYITSTAATSQYPPSPDGAILHWVHNNPSGRGHEPGYVVVDSVLFGGY